QHLADVKNVVAVRPGYRYPPAGKPVPALVVAVTPGTQPVQAAELEKKFGVAVAVTDASVDEQLAAAAAPLSFGAPQPSGSPLEKLLSGEETFEFAPPKTGTYEEPVPPNLPAVKEEMELTICVSPEAGWGELETFLAGTTQRLTVAMYQFTAPH